MQLKIERIREGQHPSEEVVSVRTADGGTEKLIVDKRSIRDGDALEIGYPVGEDRDELLVELPRESLRGLWRVWVKRDLVINGVAV